MKQRSWNPDLAFPLHNLLCSYGSSNIEGKDYPFVAMLWVVVVLWFYNMQMSVAWQFSIGWTGSLFYKMYDWFLNWLCQNPYTKLCVSVSINHTSTLILLCSPNIHLAKHPSLKLEYRKNLLHCMDVNWEKKLIPKLRAELISSSGLNAKALVIEVPNSESESRW